MYKAKELRSLFQMAVHPGRRLNLKSIIALSVAIVLLSSGIIIASIPHPGPASTPRSVLLTITGFSGDNYTLNLSQMAALPSVEGNASFQTTTGTWWGTGHYRGVLVSNLLASVGGILDGENLTVDSIDGQRLIYSAQNVFDEWKDPSVQGQMILAYEFDGENASTWSDGPMIAFLPPDHAYSNADRANTSIEAAGSFNKSAEAYCLKQVTNLTVNSLNITFAAIGDNKGRNAVLSEAIAMMNSMNVSFALHTGDLVESPSIIGLENESRVLSEAHFEWFVTPGNHDVDGHNTSIYRSIYGNTSYFVDKGPLRLISFDTSTTSVSDNEWKWLESVLDNSTRRIVVIFTHVPPFNMSALDPHTYSNFSSALRFRAIVEDHYVPLVVCGHQHLFREVSERGTNYAITGGGGADLAAPADEGGFFHFLLLRLTNRSLSVNVEML